MRPHSLLSLLLLLLIAAALPSCKSPTATTQSSAFTLILPDSTVAWGDSAMMRVVPAKPLSSSSVFTWSFGDSSSLVSRSDTIIHYYPDTGVFTVKVALNDTSNKSQLGSESGTVHVAARHFNLALLQSMPYVTVTWNARLLGQASSFGYLVPDSKPMTWFQNSFSMDSSVSYYVADSNVGQWNSGSGTIGFQGSVDSVYTQLLGFSMDTNTTTAGCSYHWQLCSNASAGSAFSIHNVAFKTQSDSDVVFEVTGSSVENASYGHSFSSTDQNGVTTSGADSANWSDASVNRYVIIRFHK